MVELQWRRRAGPAVIALGVLAILGVGRAGADERPWSPPDCASGTSGLAEAARLPRSPDAPGVTAWYRVDEELDDLSAVRGQRLTFGAGGQEPRSVALGAESFAAGPYGGLILAGSDDGRMSQLRLIDVAAGCAVTVATEEDVIRRATIEPAGGAIYEFRVDRRTRADLGVWRRPLDGSTAARPVLPPPGADARFGPTFSTELSWSVEGDRLVVQSCGEVACRTRLFDPAGGTVTLIDEADLGEVVGVTGDRLVSYEACRGLPCPIVAVDVGSGERTELSGAGGIAVLVPSAEGPRVVHEIGGDTHPELRVIDTAGREVDRLAPGEGSLRLLPTAARARAGLGTPSGWMALARDGREIGPDEASVAFRRLDSDRSVAIEEVAR